MNILKLDHAAFLVRDKDRSRQFYEQVLGMTEIESGGNCWLRHGQAEIHLLEELDGGHAQPTETYSRRELALGHTSHVAFEVADLEEAQRHLRVHTIPVACGPRPRGGGGQQLYVCDPDGYVIELFTRK